MNSDLLNDNSAPTASDGALPAKASSEKDTTSEMKDSEEANTKPDEELPLKNSKSEQQPTSSPNVEDDHEKGVIDDDKDNLADNQHQQDPTFPQQLMDAIEKETSDPSGASVTSDGKLVIEWTTNGKSFVIRDRLKFEKEVLPRYFNARCKFMSFVRKLYRWGFRKVEKNTPSGTTTFNHPYFVRGDKKRCQKMRSTVKKSSAGKHHQMAGNEVSMQSPYANSHLQGALGPNAANMFGSNNAAMFMSNAGMHMFPSLNQMDGSGLIGKHGSNSTSMFGHQYGSMTSADFFEAGLRLKRMEERQQQLMNMYNNGSNTTSSSFNSQTAMQHPSMAMNDAAPPSSSSPYGNSNNSPKPKAGKLSDIELASQLMSRDPSMDAAKALELAQCFNKNK